MKRWMPLLAMVLSVSMLVACDSGDGSDENYRFVNESSTEVYISPGPGESFTPFVLVPGASAKLPVGIEGGDELNFVISSPSPVTVNQTSDTRVVFTDPVQA